MNTTQMQLLACMPQDGTPIDGVELRRVFVRTYCQGLSSVSLVINMNRLVDAGVVGRRKYLVTIGAYRFPGTEWWIKSTGSQDSSGK